MVPHVIRHLLATGDSIASVGLCVIGGIRDSAEDSSGNLGQIARVSYHGKIRKICKLKEGFGSNGNRNK